MKKLIHNKLRLWLIILFSCLSSYVHAYDVFEVDGIYYKTISDTEVEIPYFSSNTHFYFNDIVIPETVTYNSVKYSVTSIGRSAFDGCSGLTSVTIGNSVTSIGNYAFKGCSGLTSVTIPNSVTSIGEYAFYGCSGLTSVTIPNSVTSIGGSAFYGCSGLTSVTIPNSVTSVGEYAFNGCSGLTSVTIPNSVTSIGWSAFSGCSGLTSVTIPNSVTSIGNYAFNGCTSIKEITFEDGDKTLSLGYNYYSSSSSSNGKGLFYDSPIEKLYLGRNLSYETSKRYGYSPFYGKSNLTELTIGNSVTSIGGYAFDGCSGLKNIKSKSYNIKGLADSGLSAAKVFAIITPDEINSDEVDKISKTNLTYFDNLVVESDEKTYALVTAPNYVDINDCAVKSSTIQLLPIKNEAVIRADAKSIIYAYFNGKNIMNEICGDGFKFTPTSVWKENIFVIYANSNAGGDYRHITLKQAGSLFDELGLHDIQNLKHLKITGDINGTDVMTINRMAALKYLDLSDANIVEGGVTYRENLKTQNNVVGTKFFSDIALETVLLPNSALTIDASAFENSSSLKNIIIGSATTSIKESAFNNCSKLMSVNISNSVTIIGREAFRDCSGLTSVTIGNSVTSIDSFAFSGCSGLTSVTIGSSVTSIGEFAFRGCSGLTSVTIPNSVTSIGSHAFSDCSGLTSVTIPNSVTSIGSSAFSSCSGLTSVTIPNSVTSIGSYAFYGCSGLTSVSIGNSVTSIGNYVFYLCTSLKEITFEDGDETLSLGYIDYGNSSIGRGLFYDCPLEKLYLGRNLSYKTNEEYGYSPFFGVTSLTYLTIGNSVTSIGEYAFYNCSGLTSVTIPNSVTSIGEDAFNGCSGLTSVSIGNSVTSIGEDAFYGYSGLTSVSIPNSVTTIGDYAFSGCSGLTSVFIGNSVTSIGNYAFRGCTSIKEITFDDGYKTLSLGYNGSSRGLFYDCPLEKLYLGRNLTYNSNSSYGYSPFYGNTNLTELTIGNSVTSIGESAFSGCSGLTSIIFPNSVTSISEKAFYSCTKLNSVNISDIASWCKISFGSYTANPLYYAHNLYLNGEKVENLIIPESVTSIKAYAFYGCSGLTSVSIPNSVTSIGSSAFYGCSGLTSVSIPNSVTSIGGDAFSGCSGLTSATIGKSVNSIGKEAFSGCSALQTANIPDGIVSLPEKVFYGTALTEVSLPASVTSIGESCFGNTSTITKVVSLNTTPPEIKSSTFDSEVEGKAMLHVPKGSLVHYWLDPVWKEFGNMSDDILCLDVIPDATYGDPEIDLAQFAPEGVELVYETSNSDVIEINGTMMRIVGAGEATVGAMLADGGSQMQLMGQMRQFKVNKADLSVTVADINIAQGQPLPEFAYMVEGLVYDDTVDDIETMPQAVCDVNEDSAPGEYTVEFTEGSDRNYEITTKAAKVTVTAVEPPVSNIDDIDADSDDEIEVYDMKGIRLYKGPRSEARLAKGFYLVRQGGAVAKVYVE